MTARFSVTPLTDAEYKTRTEALLSSVEASVDSWLEADVIDIDTHRTGGLLELSFPNASVIVMNVQPPLQEMWLATRSGGFHYRFADDGAWRDSRDGSELFETLSACASAQAGQPLAFTAPD